MLEATQLPTASKVQGVCMRANMSCLVMAILAYLSVVSSRETIRTMPTITSSLVNLGKMEISFHFNGNSRDPIAHQPHQSNKLASIDESCPCSYLRNIKDTLASNPIGLLNRILTSNNLFSYNNEPLTSTFCCESHESVQDTVVFDFPSKLKSKPLMSQSNTISVQGSAQPIPNNSMNLNMMPFLFNSLIPNKSLLSPMKTKSIEIFLFPKKKNASSAVKKITPIKKDLISKDNIQIVGDKELRNDIHLFKPALPVVKKDLNLQDKNEKEKEQKKIEKQIEKESDQIIIEPAGKPNSI